MKATELISGLPGEDLVRRGLADFSAGLDTVPACLVGISPTRLRRAGLLPSTVTREIPDAELKIYRRLCAEGGDAYSRYNALMREWVSFEQALEHRLRREHRA
jgi:hypothetical protein